MSNVPDARDPQNSERRNRERWIPLSTIYYLAIASGIGTSAHYLPDLAGPAPDWVRNGARLIGGCCRVPPATIHRLASIVGLPEQSTIH